MTETILVTGGAGYVGSHVVVELAGRGLRAGRPRQFREQLARRAAAPRRSSPAPRCRASRPMSATSRRCARAFHDHPITGVVHCAGLKAVGESEERPLAYYDVNVGGAFALTRGDGRGRRGDARVQLVGDRLRAAGRAAGHRGRAARAAERLRPHEARRRGFPARPRAREPQLAHRDPALLQSGRRASVGHDRRGADAAGRTIWCRCCAGSPPASSPTSRSTAPTGRRPTAPACATTSTCRTSRRATSRRCATSRGNPGRRRRSTSGTGAATRCSTWSPRSRRACGRRITRTLAPRRPGDVACYYADPARADEAARVARDARPRRDLRRCLALAAGRRAVLESGAASSAGTAMPDAIRASPAAARQGHRRSGIRSVTRTGL